MCEPCYSWVYFCVCVEQTPAGLVLALQEMKSVGDMNGSGGRKGSPLAQSLCKDLEILGCSLLVPPWEHRRDFLGSSLSF